MTRKNVMERAEITAELKVVARWFAENMVTVNAAIGDNAANIQRAIVDADLIAASCACHTIQLFVKEFVIPTLNVANIITACRECEDDEVPTVPPEIDKLSTTQRG